MHKLGLWGQHVSDYCDMFGLSQKELGINVLEYGCGPTAVNVELCTIAQSVLSCDPLFQLDYSAMEDELSRYIETLKIQLGFDATSFDFSHYGGIDAWIEDRLRGLNEFLHDYELGKKENRYQPLPETLSTLPDFSFDLALCSHHLFASHSRQDIDFQVSVITELARVAKEVRIFPLVDQKGVLSPLLGPVLLKLQQENFGVEVREVVNHLQPDNKAMLRVWAQLCRVS